MPLRPLEMPGRTGSFPVDRLGERVWASGRRTRRAESIRPEQTAKWWRRGELNPCPRSCPHKLLHVYPVVSFKEPNAAPAHCRPPSIHEVPSPPDAVAPPDD